MYGYQSTQKKIVVYTRFMQHDQQDRIHHVLFYVLKLERMDHNLKIPFFLPLIMK